jgi:hypothetical protein
MPSSRLPSFTPSPIRSTVVLTVSLALGACGGSAHKSGTVVAGDTVASTDSSGTGAPGDEPDGDEPEVDELDGKAPGDADEAMSDVPDEVDAAVPDLTDVLGGSESGDSPDAAASSDAVAPSDASGVSDASEDTAAPPTCLDTDLNGRGVDCPSGPDWDDTNALVWSSCLTCVDSDSDGVRRAGAVHERLLRGWLLLQRRLHRQVYGVLERQARRWAERRVRRHGLCGPEQRVHRDPGVPLIVGPEIE